MAKGFPKPPNCGSASGSASRGLTRPHDGRPTGLTGLTSPPALPNGFENGFEKPGIFTLAVEAGHAGTVNPAQFVTVFSAMAVIVRVLPLPEAEVVLGLTEVEVVEGLIEVVVVVVAVTVAVFVSIFVIVGIGAGYLWAQ